MMIVSFVILILAGFLAVAAGLTFWGVAAVRHARSQGGTTRERMIALAARAASDESGRGLVELLAALDGAEPGGPITLAWLHHRPVNGTEGMLVKIAWDGNEWRQVYPPATLAERLEAHLPADARDGLAGKLLADLRALV
ncbi:MAG: hypothetical protein JWM80_2746 [Cyanobacteria bacterium RYN_339]|nr:hypothetical protein [Cyanobacteria bacterium RYN_339]